MSITNIVSEENTRKFGTLDNLLKESFKNTESKHIETKVSFIDRPYISTDSNSVDLFSITNQINLSSNGGGLAMCFDLYVDIKASEILSMPESEIRDINSISNRDSVYTNSDAISESSLLIEVSDQSKLDLVNEALSLEGSDKLILNEEKTLVFNSKNSTQDKNAVEFAMYAVSLLNTILKGEPNSTVYSLLRQIDAINRKAVSNSMRQFSALLERTSLYKVQL